MAACISNYAESFATPRPFAEAGVLAALAALLAGSKLRAMLFILLAALFHPIMALAGAGALYVYMCLEDRRWIYLGVAGAVGILIAALLGLPLFSRLLERFDWNWSMILRLCASFLFPLTWKASVWAPIVINTATLGFAATAATDPIRRLFWSVLSPPWLAARQRVAWRCLPACADYSGAAVAGDLAVNAVRRDRDVLLRPAPLGGGERGAHGARPFRDRMERLRIRGRARCSALRRSRLYKFRDHFFATNHETLVLLPRDHGRFDRLGRAGRLYLQSRQGLGRRPSGRRRSCRALTSSALLRTPLTILALAWAVSNYRIPRPALLGAATALVFLAVSTWNGGTEFNRALSSNQHPPELERMVAAHPGEVLWLGESQAPWVWLSRPNWVSLRAGRLQRVFAFAHHGLAGSRSRVAGCRLDPAGRVHSLATQSFSGQRLPGLQPRENPQDLRETDAPAGFSATWNRRPRFRTTSPRKSGGLRPNLSSKRTATARSGAKFRRSR